MAQGAGKYDDECTLVREKTDAECVVLMVGGGNRGSGFSIQSISPEHIAKLPAILRSMAHEIEDDLP